MEPEKTQPIFINLFSKSDPTERTESGQKNQGQTKTSSTVCNRRLFEDIGNLSDSADIKQRESSKNFKHLGLNYLENEPIKKTSSKSKHRPLRKSLTLSGPSETKISNTTRFSETSNKLCFTQRELIQPISSRGPIGKDRYSPTQDLKDFKIIDEKKEADFNKKIIKNIRKYIENNSQLFGEIPTSNQLETIAQKFFDQKINKKKKTTDQLKRANSVSLVKSELPRAAVALEKLQKSALLIEGMISNLKNLQTSILTLLKRKKTLYKSKWIENFYEQLHYLVASYTEKGKEKNPLRTFTVILEEQIQDEKIKEIIALSFNLQQKELENLILHINKWAINTEILPQLSERVAILDRKNIVDSINSSIKDIPSKKHEWFESLESKRLINHITTEEIIRCLIPDSLVLYKKITVNKKTIQLKINEKSNTEPQVRFFSQLLYEIYAAGFNVNMTQEMARAQAISLVAIPEISHSIKEYLIMEMIPWEQVQLMLSPYQAIPFFKFKANYDSTLHLHNLNEYLVELTVPCIDVLKLCANDCWLIAEECIRYLHPDLFVPYGQKMEAESMTTVPEKGVECHIHIQNDQDYSVAQIKKYGTYPPDLTVSSGSSLNKKCNLAKMTFKWSVSPYIDPESNIKSWKGLLEIPNVIIDSKTPPDVEKKILKILNNPTIVDFVTNSLTGQPKIISY